MCKFYNFYHFRHAFPLALKRSLLTFLIHHITILYYAATWQNVCIYIVKQPSILLLFDSSFPLLFAVYEEQ